MRANWFSRDAHCHQLVADGYGDGVLIVAMQNDGIAGRHFHIKDLHIIVVQGEMMVWLVVHCGNGGRLGRQPNWHKANRHHINYRVMFIF